MVILNKYKYIIVSVLMIISILSINVIKPKAELIDSINLINNGNFANGTTGWLDFNSSMNISEGICTFIALQRFGGIRKSINSNYINGHKYYISSRIKLSTSHNQCYIYMDDGVTTPTFKCEPTTDWQVFDNIINWSSSGSQKFIMVRDYRVSGWDEIKVDYLMLIDLTATFGAGNEPNIIDCRVIYSEYFEGLKRQDIKPHDVIENAHKTVIQMIVSTMLVPIDMLKTYKVGNHISLFDIFIGMIILVILTKTILKIGGRTSNDVR